jgi:hypothetical protein
VGRALHFALSVFSDKAHNYFYKAYNFSDKAHKFPYKAPNFSGKGFEKSPYFDGVVYVSHLYSGIKKRLRQKFYHNL